MPHSDLHKQKKKKNYTLLVLVFLWCVIIFSLTIIKMARADTGDNSHIYWQDSSDTATEAPTHPKDWNIPEGAYHEGRAQYSGHAHSRQEQWHQDYTNVTAPVKMGIKDKMDADRTRYNNHIIVTGETWDAQGSQKLQQQNAAAATRDNDRAAHSGTLADRPPEWWDSWLARYRQ